MTERIHQHPVSLAPELLLDRHLALRACFDRAGGPRGRLPAAAGAAAVRLVVDVSDTDGNRFALGQEESVTTPDVENGKPAPTYE